MAWRTAAVFLGGFLDAFASWFKALKGNFSFATMDWIDSYVIPIHTIEEESTTTTSKSVCSRFDSLSQTVYIKLKECNQAFCIWWLKSINPSLFLFLIYSSFGFSRSFCKRKGKMVKPLLSQRIFVEKIQKAGASSLSASMPCAWNLGAFSFNLKSFCK